VRLSLPAVEINGGEPLGDVFRRTVSNGTQYQTVEGLRHLGRPGLCPGPVTPEACRARWGPRPQTPSITNRLENGEAKTLFQLQGSPRKQGEAAQLYRGPGAVMRSTPRRDGTSLVQGQSPGVPFFRKAPRLTQIIAADADGGHQTTTNKDAMVFETLA